MRCWFRRAVGVDDNGLRVSQRQKETDAPATPGHERRRGRRQLVRGTVYTGTRVPPPYIFNALDRDPPVAVYRGAGVYGIIWVMTGLGGLNATMLNGASARWRAGVTRSRRRPEA